MILGYDTNVLKEPAAFIFEIKREPSKERLVCGVEKGGPGQAVSKLMKLAGP
jgi:hypothetical protein